LDESIPKKQHILALELAAEGGEIDRHGSGDLDLCFEDPEAYITAVTDVCCPLGVVLEEAWVKVEVVDIKATRDLRVGCVDAKLQSLARFDVAKGCIDTVCRCEDNP
tara:strand:- start:4655 stop:4975 length:321 start_codon:yes stop_codon:yes gene_type:complete